MIIKVAFSILLFFAMANGIQIVDSELIKENEKFSLCPFKNNRNQKFICWGFNLEGE